jgi:hypothetical protein
MSPRRRRQNPPIAEFLNDAAETAVDTLFDRAAGAFANFKDRAIKQQREALPSEYRAGEFSCAGCKKKFAIGDMEQVHPSNGWGTCRGCYGFMFQAAKEKMKAFAKRATKAGAQRAATAEPKSPGFRPPPPPPGPPPWEVLGVAQDADLVAIKKAYRKLAMLYHPDRMQAEASWEEKERAKAMFQAVTRARDVMVKVRSPPSV